MQTLPVLRSESITEQGRVGDANTLVFNLTKLRFQRRRNRRIFKVTFHFLTTLKGSWKWNRKVIITAIVKEISKNSWKESTLLTSCNFSFTEKLILQLRLALELRDFHPTADSRDVTQCHLFLLVCLFSVMGQLWGTEEYCWDRGNRKEMQF